MTTSTTRRSLLLAAPAILIAPGPSFAADKKPAPLAADVAGIAPMISGSGKPVLPPGSVVHIPTFRLEVIKQMSKTATTSGYAAATQTTTASLQGIDDGQIGFLCQVLYDDLVATLKARGHTVATQAETRADPDLGPMMAGLARSPLLSPSAAGLSTFYAPTGMGVYLPAVDPSASTAGGAMGGFAAMGPIMQRALAVNRAVQRKLAVIEPRYSLGFADLEGSASRLAGVASVSSNFGLRIVAEATRWDVMAPAANRNGLTGGHYAVDRSLLVSGQALGAPFNGPATSQVQSAAVANAFGALLATQGIGGAGNYGANSKGVATTPAYFITANEALIRVQAAMLAKVS